MKKTIKEKISALWPRQTETSKLSSESSEFTREASYTSVLVIGKAKTGTTFLAKAIQNSLSACSLEMEPKAAEFIFDRYREKSSGNEVAKIIFEHWSNKPNLMSALLADELPVKFDKKVIIVRDPRDELVSRLLYLVKPLKDQGKLTDAALDEWLVTLRTIEGGEKKINFQELLDRTGELFNTDLLPSFVNYMKEFSDYFQSKPNSVFAVRYEDLIDKRVEHLEKYLGFSLNYAITEDDLIKRTKRSSSYGSWKSFFHEEDIEYFKPIMAEFMDQIGYNDWSISSAKLPQKDVTSSYVERLASG